MADVGDLFDNEVEDDVGEGDAEEAHADSGSEQEGLEDSSEEDDGDNNEYDFTDKFIVGEDEAVAEENDEGSSDEQLKVKKKRKRHFALEDDDYELLEENHVTGIRRPKAERKRIHKRSDEAATGTQEKSAAEQLKDVLFGPDDDGLEDELEDDRAKAPQKDAEEVFEDDFEDDDEFRDFIDDDLADGEPAGRARRRRRRVTGLPAGVSAAALREAQEIFGDVTALLDVYSSRKRPDNDEEEDPPQDDEDEDGGEFYLQQAERARQKALKKVVETVEPELMARHFMLPEDERVRTVDLPERQQQMAVDRPEAVDFERCARWIYDRLFGKDAQQRLEQDLVDDGRREVDGPPADGRVRWGRHELEGGIIDLQGFRGIMRKREKEDRRQWRESESAQLALRAAIAAVLKQLHDKHEEVPLVAMYRKELCGELLAQRREDLSLWTSAREARQRADRNQPIFHEGTVQAKHRRIRRWEVLWAINNWSQKWLQLHKRKEIRSRTYLAAAERATSDEERQAITSCITALSVAASVEELEDVDHKFKLTVSVTGPELALSQLAIDERGQGSRRPQRSSTYALCKRGGLDVVVAALGLSPDKYAENLEALMKKHEPEDLRVAPEEFASQHVTQVGGFETPESVVRGACHMAAAQLAVEPGVRQHVRNLYYKFATVSTEATKRGEAVLDPFHPLGIVRRLRNKPVQRFEDSDQFLRMAIAEREGLLTVNMEVPDGDLQDSIVKDMKDLYVSEAVSTISQAWNELRRQILHDTLRVHLLPALEKELRARLTSDAREVVLRDAADGLWKYAVQAPLQVKVPEEDEFIDNRRFMACCWGPGEPATVLVMLDQHGQLVDMLHCGQLSGVIRRPPRARFDDALAYNMFNDPNKAKDAERIRDFILEHSPHVVLVGASGMECRQLKEDLDSIRDHILMNMPRFLTTSDTGNIDVRYADETLAALWESSAAAKEDMPEQGRLVRRAVALGRLALDPLAILAALCGANKEVLALQLHPLQTALPDDDLVRTIEQVLITAVSQVGVDINAMATSMWQAAPLGFVAGLGPRKARMLLAAVQRAGHVESRHQIWRDLGVLGNCVFRNCAPFIRVRSSGAGMANVQLDHLDDSRVHPESYTRAIQMAQSAVGEEEENEMVVVEKAVGRPRDVEALDVEAFNLMLMDSEKRASSLSTLIDIQFEIIQPFGDLRPEAGPPKEDEVFWMLSGESKDTLKEGKKVEAQVRYVSEDEARCVLNDLSNLEAVISREDISSDGPVNPRDRLEPNTTVTARIKGIDTRNFVVSLTTASKEVNDDLRWEEEYCDDQFYHIPSVEEVRQEADQRRRTSKKMFVSRPIRHPLFKNYTMVEAADALAGSEVGECLFRPSPRGTHQLCVSVKLHDGPAGPHFLHTDVKEDPRAKGSSGMGSHLTLGTPLTIEMLGGKEKETYEDLDEVVARYVEPYVANVKELVRHRKFREGLWQNIKEQLREEKKRSAAPVYCLGIMYDHPGMYFLGFVLNTTPHQEVFSITPKGFYFRKKVLKLEKALAAFKKNPQGDKGALAQQATGVPYEAPVAAGMYASYQQSYVAQGAAAHTGVAYGYDDANWQQQTGVAWGAQYAQYRVPPPPVTGRDSQSFAR